MWSNVLFGRGTPSTEVFWWKAWLCIIMELRCCCCHYNMFAFMKILSDVNEPLPVHKTFPFRIFFFSYHATLFPSFINTLFRILSLQKIFHFSLFLCFARCEPFGNLKYNDSGDKKKWCYIDHQLFSFVFRLLFFFSFFMAVWTIIENIKIYCHLLCYHNLRKFS